MSNKKTVKSSPVKEKAQSQKKSPELFDVVLLNNDATSFDYAMVVVTNVFGFEQSKARSKVAEIDAKGEAVVATLPKKEAEAKLKELNDLNSFTSAPIEAKIQPAAPAPAAPAALELPTVTVKLNKTPPNTSSYSEKMGVFLVTMTPNLKGKKEAEKKAAALDIIAGHEFALKSFDDTTDGRVMMKKYVDMAKSHFGSLITNGVVSIKVRSPGEFLVFKEPAQTQEVSKKSTSSSSEQSDDVGDNFVEELFAGTLNALLGRFNQAELDQALAKGEIGQKEYDAMMKMKNAGPITADNLKEIANQVSDDLEAAKSDNQNQSTNPPKKKLH